MSPRCTVAKISSSDFLAPALHAFHAHQPPPARASASSDRVTGRSQDRKRKTEAFIRLVLPAGREIVLGDLTHDLKQVRTPGPSATRPCVCQSQQDVSVADL